MNFLEAVGLFSTVVGLFALIDLFPSDARKHKISEYVFGFHNIKFSEFERGSIRFLIQLVMKEERVSKLKVFKLISLPTGFILFGITLVISVLQSDGNSQSSGNFWIGLGFIIIAIIFASILLALLGYIWDFWSITVTHELFIKRSPVFPKTLLYLFADVFLSFIIPFIIQLTTVISCAAVLSISTRLNVDADAMTGMLVVFIMLQFGFLASSLVLSFIQVTTLVGGVILRGLVTITRANMYIAAHSNIYNYPFTFIGMVLGAIFAGTLAIAT